jgi:hypothetical protein
MRHAVGGHLEEVSDAQREEPGLARPAGRKVDAEDVRRSGFGLCWRSRRYDDSGDVEPQPRLAGITCRGYADDRVVIVAARARHLLDHLSGARSIRVMVSFVSVRLAADSGGHLADGHALASGQRRTSEGGRKECDERDTEKPAHR